MHATRRDRQRRAMGEEIKRVARHQMAAHGAAALSLRGIAAEMKLTAPALYRYFPSRDELVTALIVDAYRALGDAIDAAQAGPPPADYPARYLAAALAYRDWSLAHRAEFDLIFGSPIPGYHAPPQVTVPVARRAFEPIVGIALDAWAAGRLDPPPPTAAPATDERLGAFLANDGADVPPALLRLLLEGWGLMHGALTLELLGHLPPLLGDAAEFYEAAIRSLVERLGFRPES